MGRRGSAYEAGATSCEVMSVTQAVAGIVDPRRTNELGAVTEVMDQSPALPRNQIPVADTGIGRRPLEHRPRPTQTRPTHTDSSDAPAKGSHY